MEEVWRDIEGFENSYQVSNFGRVRSLSRYINLSYKGKPYVRYHNGRVLSAKKDKDGYLLVSLGKNCTMKVHRIVAQAFIPNPANLPQVNHKDEVKSNNVPSNLEWCTSRYNNCYGTHLQKSGLKHRKPVMQLDKQGKFLKVFESLKQAEQSLKIKGASTPISRCCYNKKKSAYGYKWKFYDKSI